MTYADNESLFHNVKQQEKIESLRAQLAELQEANQHAKEVGECHAIDLRERDASIRRYVQQLAERDALLKKMEQAEPVAYKLTLEELTRTDGRTPILILGSIPYGARLFLHPPVAKPLPDGWVAVPMEPTEKMAGAGWDDAVEHEADNVDIYDIAAIYKAMIAARPKGE